MHGEQIEIILFACLLTCFTFHYVRKKGSQLNIVDTFMYPNNSLTKIFGRRSLGKSIKHE